MLDESISRAPGFIFKGLHEACLFVDWATAHMADIRRIAESTTSHGRLIDLEATVEGNHVYLNLSFVTGEAAGQNMVTIATEAVLAFIDERAPVRPLRAFVEGNHSGDKKACMRSFTSVRGKRVCAEVVLPAAVVEERLRVTGERLAEFWRLSALGSVLSGAMGIQGHFANGLAALYIACGQDAILGTAHGNLRILARHLVDPLGDGCDLGLRKLRLTIGHARFGLACYELDERAFGALTGDDDRAAEVASGKDRVG